jgi:hypothetical protein
MSSSYDRQCIGFPRCLPLIAAFWADVDTRPAGSHLVTYGTMTFEGHPTFCADWPYVGYWNESTDKLNDFQMLLVSREDVAPGALEIVLNYDQVQWETGTFDEGTTGSAGRRLGSASRSATGARRTRSKWPARG